jgi:hypothetical protein
LESVNSSSPFDFFVIISYKTNKEQQAAVS